jgi:hypothetical protein
MKNSNLLLLLTLLLLGGFVYYTFFLNEEKKSNFKTDIIAIDTAQVDRIVLLPKALAGASLIFNKKAEGWEMAQEDGTNTSIEKEQIDRMLGTLLTTKPRRLATKNESKWASYEVDDAQSSKVKVYEGSKEVLDLHVGKFSFKQLQPSNPQAAQGGPQQNMQLTSYVRLGNGSEVYAVDGMLNMTFNRKPEDFLPPPPEVETASDSTGVAMPAGN